MIPSPPPDSCRAFRFTLRRGNNTVGAGRAQQLGARLCLVRLYGCVGQHEARETHSLRLRSHLWIDAGQAPASTMMTIATLRTILFASSQVAMRKPLSKAVAAPKGPTWYALQTGLQQSPPQPQQSPPQPQQNPPQPQQNPPQPQQSPPQLQQSPPQRLPQLALWPPQQRPAPVLPQQACRWNCPGRNTLSCSQ